MTVEISIDGSAPNLEPAAAAATIAPGDPVPGTMRIEGVDRAIFTCVVSGKTVVYTSGLSFDEEWQVERSLDTRDMGGPGTMRAMALSTVRLIDGSPVPFPSKDLNFKSVTKSLGDVAAKFIYRQYIKNITAVEADTKNG